VKCPIHPEEEMRIEWVLPVMYVCSKCMNPRLVCAAPRFMRPCIRFKDHDGDHVNVKGERWPR